MLAIDIDLRRSNFKNRAIFIRTLATMSYILRKLIAKNLVANQSESTE